MKLFSNQTFDRFYEDGRGSTFADMEFDRCRFAHCNISMTNDPRLRTTVRDVVVRGCASEGCTVSPAILENVLVDGFETDRLFQAWAAVFKHVTLAGKIGRLMFSGILCPISSVTSSMQRAFAEANAAYYANVDWALDISRAEFRECDIRGIPARLIRRDPETQTVVTRAKAAEGRWRELDLSKTHWQTAIDFLLTERPNDPDVVLVAPKRARDFRDLMDGIRLLRREGVAEPD